MLKDSPPLGGVLQLVLWWLAAVHLSITGTCRAAHSHAETLHRCVIQPVAVRIELQF